MNTEQYNVMVSYKGEQHAIPVTIRTEDENVSICADIDGKEIFFLPDTHDGLRAMDTEYELDEELLYQVGKAIRQQRPAREC